ncbi:hypothetical protein RVR_6622 [Actinacidiphila reveromycinica]|uniref:Dipeptidyl aminopeptidase n=1 Tax=Actinacidiphila reveromycinica TaxID=659352 RepID=A0A7U3VQN2_9ACTN|nr:hypothetical protein [Streptomyces sp. SN-593]BBA99829.1 hypothetical protein RVR_6622 [Streptomyces sp. SN-593]
MITENSGTAVRADETVFMSTAGLPRRFRSNFDFQLALALGSADHGGAAVGECYATAARIEDGDLAGWHRAWSETARRVQETGSRCLAEGHHVSAGEAFLRASTYWRAAGMFLGRADASRIPTWEKNRECFRTGLRLTGVPFEEVRVPYENGKFLPGYFLTPDGPSRPRATAVVIGGGDMTAEELYFFTAAAAVRRGYNAFVVELPGQRGAYYSDPDLTFRPDLDVQMGYVVDYALSRADVDPERLSLTGYSMGGLFVPRAVAREKRIKAAVASTLTPSFRPSILSLIGLKEDESYADIDDLDSRVDLSSPMASLLLGDVRERFGMLDRPLRDYLDYLGEFDIWGLEDQITCPLLNIGGAGEGSLASERRAFYERLSCVKAERFIAESEGGEAHCAANNRVLANQIEFDFLDDVFARNR